MSNTRGNCIYIVNQQNVRGKLVHVQAMNDSWGREKKSPFFLELWTQKEMGGKFHDPGSFTFSEKKSAISIKQETRIIQPSWILSKY